MQGFEAGKLSLHGGLFKQAQRWRYRWALQGYAYGALLGMLLVP